ncbi:hypothetical protein D3C76_1874220 [compost metagenome]
MIGPDEAEHRVPELVGFFAGIMQTHRLDGIIDDLLYKAVQNIFLGRVIPVVGGS